MACNLVKTVIELGKQKEYDGRIYIIKDRKAFLLQNDRKDRNGK